MIVISTLAAKDRGRVTALIAARARAKAVATKSSDWLIGLSRFTAFDI